MPTGKRPNIRRQKRIVWVSLKTTTIKNAIKQAAILGEYRKPIRFQQLNQETFWVSLKTVEKYIQTTNK